MRKYASVAGFAKWLGRSESLIRNIESGSTGLSKQLAKLIELKAGVSADWIMSDGARETAILAKDGSLWNPANFIDPYAKGGLLSNMGLLMESDMKLVPAMVGALVEARIMLELFRAGVPEGGALLEDGKEPDLRVNFEGLEVLRDVLKAIQLQSTGERNNLGQMLEYVLKRDRPSEDLLTTWKFMSIRERRMREEGDMRR